MKTLRILNGVHQKLTAMFGKLMAQTGRMQTYQDAIEAMLNQSVILPPELLAQIQNFIEENKHLGFTTREEFMRDAARWRLKFLNEDSEHIEIPREKYEMLEAAVKEMNSPTTAHQTLSTNKLTRYWKNTMDGLRKKKNTKKDNGKGKAIGVSRAILMGILSELHVWLSELETEELYRELLAYFGLVGALNECQAVENAWKNQTWLLKLLIKVRNYLYSSRALRRKLNRKRVEVLSCYSPYTACSPRMSPNPSVRL